MMQKVPVGVLEDWGVYPWRSLKRISVLTMRERKMRVVKYMQHFVATDRARKHPEALQRKE